MRLTKIQAEKVNSLDDEVLGFCLFAMIAYDSEGRRRLRTLPLVG